MSNIPSLWLEFDENGAIDAGAAAQLTQLLNAPGIEDLVVMSHGWKNDKADATTLYRTLWTNACRNFPSGRADKIVVVGVLWPAKAYQTDFDEAALAAANAGGALSAGGGGLGADLSQQQFEALLADFENFIGASAADTIAAARVAAQQLNATASHDLVKKGAAVVAIDVRSPDAELKGDFDPDCARFGRPYRGTDAPWQSCGAASAQACAKGRVRHGTRQRRAGTVQRSARRCRPLPEPANLF